MPLVDSNFAAVSAEPLGDGVHFRKFSQVEHYIEAKSSSHQSVCLSFFLSFFSFRFFSSLWKKKE